MQTATATESTTATDDTPGGNAPELTLKIGDREFGFSELPDDRIPGLNVWLKDHYPNPIASLVGHLDGLPSEDRRYLLDQARKEVAQYPPTMGRFGGFAKLLSTSEGQIQALFVAFGIHHPSITRKQAAKLYWTLFREGTDMAAAASKVGEKYEPGTAINSIYEAVYWAYTNPF